MADLEGDVGVVGVDLVLGGEGGPSIGLASVGPAPEPAIDDANIVVSASPAPGGAPGGGNVLGLMGGAGDTNKKATF